MAETWFHVVPLTVPAEAWGFALDETKCTKAPPDRRFMIGKPIYMIRAICKKLPAIIVKIT